jgi:hypothetical protein
MQPQPDEHKRQRSTQAQLKKYGRNPRKLMWNEYGPVKTRVQYLCDILFAGNYHEMALAVGMCYRHLYRILYGHSRLSIRFAGQLVSRLGVRAEWLLCGSGPVFPWPDQVEHFQYMPRVDSCYHLLDTHALASGTYFLPAVQPDTVTELSSDDTANIERAAQCLFQASANQKPVWFFLDSPAFTETTTALWQSFLTRRYATLVTVTLAAACADLAYADEMPRPDVNTLALTAATQGAGYGETICRFGFQSAAARKRSVLATAFDLGVPTFVSAAIGEIPNHTNPAVRDPELGAAVGAAAYVDLLAFSAHVPNFFGSPGGVVLACGNSTRAIELFLSRLPPLRHTNPQQSGVVFILFQPHDAADLTLQETIHSIGGRVIYVPKPTATSIQQLLQTCDDAYAGKSIS